MKRFARSYKVGITFLVLTILLTTISILYVNANESIKEDELIEERVQEEGQLDLSQTPSRDEEQVSNIEIELGEQAEEHIKELEDDTLIKGKVEIDSIEVSVPEEFIDPLLEIKTKSIANRELRLYKKDRFNYKQQDVEKLLLGGATLEDIYISDQIGNQWLVDPWKLIELQRGKDQKWEEVEGMIAATKMQELEEVTKKYPDIQKEFSQIIITPAEQLELIQFIADSKLVSDTIDSVIKVYAENNVAGLEHFQENLNDQDNETSSEVDANEEVRADAEEEVQEANEVGAEGDVLE